jgi:S-adenosylmethionine:tRNA-ribosyltransferase-isomerase (queuine synthetase)
MHTLDTLAVGEGRTAPLEAQKAWADLYIYPSFEFRAADDLLTSLRSRHIVLTAALAGKDFAMSSYSDIAKSGNCKFDMFGDSMLTV